MDAAGFERSCRDLSRQLAVVPGKVAAALEREAPSKVAEPVARRVAARWSGPWAGVLAAATKAITGSPTGVVVGGTAPVVSSGASVNDLVWGNEYGGGRRPTTQQFVPRHPAVITTIEGAVGELEDAYADIVQDELEEVARGQA